MSFVDNKLLERFQMFEEIDKMVKRDGSNNFVDTGSYKNKNLNERGPGLPKAGSNPNILNSKNSNLNNFNKGYGRNHEGENSEREKKAFANDSIPNNNTSPIFNQSDHTFDKNFNYNNVANKNNPCNNIKLIENNFPEKYNSGKYMNNCSPVINKDPNKEYTQLINFTKNKSKPVLGSENIHFNNIYFSNNNQNEPVKIDKIKGCKTSFNSNSSYSNNFNTSNKKLLVDPSEIGERLYKKAFLIQGKLDKMRKDEETKRKRSMTPEISPVAKKIKRDPKKFPDRLYPGNDGGKKTIGQTINKNPQEVQIINTVMDIGFLKNIEKNYQSERINQTPNLDNTRGEEKIGGIDKENQNKNDEHIINPKDNFNINDKTSIQNEEEYLDKFYKKNKEKSEYYNFNHKPKLNRNSLKIAEQLQPAKERLVSKKKSSTSRSPSRTPPKIKNATNFSYISDDGFDPLTNKMRSKSPNPTSRVKELYQKGLEQKKKIETLHDQKKKMEQEEYKKFTFKPKIIKNSPVLISKISGDNNEKLNKSSENMTKENEKTKYDMYEKQLNWKKNIENNNKRLKKTFDDEKKKNLSFKPVIHKNIPENDEKFIMKNLEQIEEYVNRRRNHIQKQKEDEEYKKKIFPNGENFKLKPTVAKEFKFKTDERSRSRSADRSRSKEPRNNSPRNVKMMRKKMNAGDFFEIPNQENVNERYLETNLSHNKNKVNYYYSFNDAVNNSRANITPNTESSGFAVEEEEKVAFVNAINNLHSKLVNFKF